MVSDVKETAKQERLYEMYKTFFDKAEQERRWNPLRDVPYEKINHEIPESILVVAETFCLVESFLPDYVSAGINVVRPYFGQAWFAANWAYEESKHSVALMEYLLQSKRRTPETLFDLQSQLMKTRWEMPFPTSRQMTIYGCFQEMATFVIYVKQGEALQGGRRRVPRDDLPPERAGRDRALPLLPGRRQSTFGRRSPGDVA